MTAGTLCCIIPLPSAAAWADQNLAIKTEEAACAAERDEWTRTWATALGAPQGWAGGGSGRGRQDAAERARQLAPNAR